MVPGNRVLAYNLLSIVNSLQISMTDSSSEKDQDRKKDEGGKGGGVFIWSNISATCFFSVFNVGKSNKITP